MTSFNIQIFYKGKKRTQSFIQLLTPLWLTWYVLVLENYSLFFSYSFFVIEICTWNLFLGICSEMLLILLLLWTREGNKTSELLSREAWRGTRSENATSIMPFSILLLQLTYISTHITNLPCDFICALNRWAILFDCKGSFKQRVLNMH